MTKLSDMKLISDVRVGVGTLRSGGEVSVLQVQQLMAWCLRLCDALERESSGLRYTERAK